MDGRVRQSADARVPAGREAEALRESERRFQEIFEQVAVGISRVDLDGVLVDVNEKFCSMLGYSKQELLGKHIRDITYPEDAGQGSRYRAELTRRVLQSATGEKRFVRKDGSVLWARRTMSTACDAQGRPRFVISFVEDISEHKRAERELQRTTRLAQLLESLAREASEAASPEIAMRASLERICEHGGWAVGRLGIYRAGQGERFPEISMWHPSETARFEPLVRASGDPRYFAPSGRFISVVLNEKRPVWLGDLGNAGGFGRMRVALDCGLRSAFAFPVIVDGQVAAFLEFFGSETREPYVPLIEAVTTVGAQLARLIERRRADEALRASEQTFRATFDNAPVGIMHTGVVDERILLANSRLCEMVGYTRDELAQMRTYDLVHPEFIGKDRESYREQMLAGEIETFSSERRYRRKDGSNFWVSRTVSLARDGAGMPLYFIRIIEDISQRKTAEEAVRRERSMLRTIIDALPDRVYVKDREGRQLMENAASNAKRVPYTPDAVGKTVFDLFPPELAERMQAEDRMIIESGRSLVNRERSFVSPSGEVSWEVTSKVPFRDAAGQVAGIVGVSRDVTGLKQAEAERTRLAAIVESTGDAIISRALDGTILTWNPGAERLFGWRVAEAIGANIAIIMPPGLKEEVERKSERLLRGESISAFDTVRRRKDESLVNVSLSQSPILNEHREPVAISSIFRDITERTISARRRAMEHAVTKVLAEAATVHEAMPRMIRIMCEAMGWAYGAYWSWSDTAQTLVRNDYWSDFDLRFVGEEEVPWTRLRHQSPGGLIRRAWFDKQSTWIADLRNDDSFSRREDAMRRGLHSAYSFPVISGSDAVGIMEFYGREPREPDDMLLDISGSIGRQIGQFVRRKHAEEAQRQSEAMLSATFEQAGVGMAMRDIDPSRPRWIRVNQKLCDILGYSREELLQMTSIDVTPPEDRDAAKGFNEKMRHGELQSYAREKRYMRKDGQVIWANVSLSTVSGPDGRPTHVISVIQDISDRKQAEAALRESEEQFRQLANNIPQAFWITDTTHRKTIYLSPAASALIGRPMEELYADPRALVRAVHPEDRRRIHRARKQAARAGYDETYRVVRPDGTIRWVNDRAFPVHDASGRAYRVAGIAEDVTDRKLAEERLLQLAHYDVLTSLPNRVLFYDRLHQALAQSRRNRWIGAVLFIDVDRFKNVNDTLGHAVGDRLLQQISGRLAGSVRTGDTVGRLGGDEFAIILSNLASAQDANLVAQKLMAAFKEPIKLDSTEIYVTASIGITLFPADSSDPDALIRNADTAMYRAKEVGRNSYQFYTPEMNARALEALSMENSLRRALDRDEFTLYFQPKASIADGRIVGVEALLRWLHPERGLVSPAQFMAVLEETGLIVQVGEWVLRRVCDQIKAWERAGIKPPAVSVNLSARQFNTSDLGQAVKSILEEKRVAPEMIELEITESSLMINTENAVATLQYLSDLGVGLAIDDFGTGYSSLSYLKRFPLDALKIDRSFIRDITSDSDDAAITRAVISMAHSLGLMVVAEGVESVEQLMLLAGDGCDQIQGYYFSFPLQADECAQWLLEDRRLLRST